MLRIEDLELKIKEKVIFTQVSVQLNSQDILIVNGRNGIGKTSFLKVISGLLEQSNGKILCADCDIREYMEDYIYDYSYMCSDDIFNHDFIVSYYINFWCNSNESYDYIDSILKYLGLNKILIMRISQISSGWRKRVMMAKLMIENRLIWFLDEPFNFLDEYSRDLLVNIVNSRLLSGGLVVLTSNQKIDFFKTAKYMNFD